MPYPHYISIGLLQIMKTRECPHCGAPVRLDDSNPYRPFCSRRCKLIDLGDWIDESNRIPDRDQTASDWSVNDGSYRSH